MRGILILVCVGAVLKLLAEGWIAFAFLPILGILWLVSTAKKDPADEVFAAGFFVVLILGAAAAVKAAFGFLEGVL